MSNYKGNFIVIEGADASGKTTTINDLKEILPKDEFVFTREPGGSEVAEQIRKLLLNNPTDEKISLETQSYLFAAARKQHMMNTIIPALQAGKSVVCDRFLLSSLVYQSNVFVKSVTGDKAIDEKLFTDNVSKLISVLHLNELALYDEDTKSLIVPDKTIYFSVSAEEMSKRMSARQKRLSKKSSTLDDKDKELNSLEAKKELLRKYRYIIELLKGDCVKENLSSSSYKNLFGLDINNRKTVWHDFLNNICAINADDEKKTRLKTVLKIIDKN